MKRTCKKFEFLDQKGSKKGCISTIEEFSITGDIKTFEEDESWISSDVELGRHVVMHGSSYDHELGYRGELEQLSADRGLHYLPTGFGKSAPSGVFVPFCLRCGRQGHTASACVYPAASPEAMHVAWMEPAWTDQAREEPP